VTAQANAITADRGDADRRALFDFVYVRWAGYRLACDVHCTTADDCTATCAGAKFRESHLYRHSIVLFNHAGRMCAAYARSAFSRLRDCGEQTGFATRFDPILRLRKLFCPAAHQRRRLMYHLGAISMAKGANTVRRRQRVDHELSHFSRCLCARLRLSIGPPHRGYGWARI